MVCRTDLEGERTRDGGFGPSAGIESMRRTKHLGGQIDPADRRRPVLFEVVEHGTYLL
jgi:hypothetical protein